MSDRFTGYAGTFINDPETGERVPTPETVELLRAQRHPDYPEISASVDPAPVDVIVDPAPTKSKK